MEKLWADSSGQDSYDPYTCAVNNALFLECLDIAGARTLGGSLSDTVAYNMSGSSGDLNRNFYAVLELEGLLNMSGSNVSTHFGGVPCNGKVVGDGAVNAYDMATLMWYQFKFEPYDQLPNDPSIVPTVQGRDDTGFRCGLGETRRMWQIAVGDDYCHSGQNAVMLGYERRLSDGGIEQPSVLFPDLFAPYRMDIYQMNSRRLDLPTVAPNIAYNARETRPPEERRESINREDMLRGINSMRTLDVDVAEWGVVEGYGRWIRLRAPGVQVAMELYLSGISVDNPVHLSLQSVPTKNCTKCKPIDEDPRNVVLAFARRTEYEDEYANAISVPDKQVCANIVPAVIQSHAMFGNTIGVRQQPPNKACGFDLFLWIPSFPKYGVHISKQTSPYSFSARRLAAVGAESALMTANGGCNDDIGVLSGSSAMDGFRGQIQRVLSCTRYGFTTPEIVRPVPSIVMSVACRSICSMNAPSLETSARSTNTGASKLGMMYTDSLRMLTGSFSRASIISPGQIMDYYDFETSLARNSLGSCCAGSMCVSDSPLNTTGICELIGPATPPTPPPVPMLPSPSMPVIHPSSPPGTPPHPPPLSPSPPPQPSAPLTMEVVFNVTIEGGPDTFNGTAYALRVANIVGVMIQQVSIEVQSASIVVKTTIKPWVVADEVSSGDDTPSAEEVLQILESTVLANTTAATEWLGVTVNTISHGSIVYAYYSPPPGPLVPSPALPPAPLAPVSNDGNLGLILGLGIGLPMGMFVIAGVVIAAWYINTPPKETAKSLSERQGLNDASRASGASGYQHSYHSYNKAISQRSKADYHGKKLADAFAVAATSSSKKPTNAGPSRPMARPIRIDPVQNTPSQNIPKLSFKLG